MSEGWTWNVWFDTAHKCAVAESQKGEHVSARFYRDEPVDAINAAFAYTAKPVKTATFVKPFHDYLRS